MNVMNEDFVTYEQAVDLQRFGFDWKCNHYFKWNNLNPIEYIVSHESAYVNWNHENHRDFWQYSAPTMAQVVKWLRNEKHLLVSVRANDFVNDSGNAEIYYCVDVFDIKDNVLKLKYSNAGFENYESAFEDGINNTLAIILKEGK